MLPQTYDGDGNRVQKSNGRIYSYGCTQESLSVTATANNQLSAMGYSYDAAGHMLTDGHNTYTWYSEGSLASAAGQGYLYDANGNRTEKSGLRLYWFGGGSAALDESNSTGTVTDEYVYLGSQRIAHIAEPSGTVYYYAQDQLGTSRELVQAGQTSPCYDADFYPFGTQRADITTCDQNYKFTGKERDSESNLDNFGARYMGSSLGRFLSPDKAVDQHPEDPQSWNLYSYVRNNPLSSIDQDGNYDCGQITADQCTQFGNNLTAAQNQLATALQNGNITDAQFKQGSDALGAYGTLNDNNGVTVNVGATGGYPGTTSVSNDGTVSAANPTGQNIQVTFNPGVFGGNSDSLNGVIGHEGSHVEDGEAWAKAGFADAANPTHFDTEFKAYGVTSIFGAAQGAGILRGTKPGDTTPHLFWEKNFPDAVNGALRTTMIKTLYPNWAEKAFQANTNPEKK